MLDRTRRLWEKQYHLVGDRRGLFAAVADAIDVQSVLYPGSYVDVTPSMIWRSVTYVDVDRRAHQLFTDTRGVQEILADGGGGTGRHDVHFIHDDYSHDLPLDDASFDLLLSLFAGFVSEHCSRYLRVGGFLLVAPSHGDAAMASIDRRYRLHSTLVSEPEGYRIDTDSLDDHLVPERDIDVTIDHLHETGRGVEYTKSPYAYLFQRVT